MPGAITHLLLTPATATIAAGGNQSYTAIGADTYNNPAGDVTSTAYTLKGGSAGVFKGSSDVYSW